MHMDAPNLRMLQLARDEFRALLERQTKEAHWQRFFAEHPYVLSTALPLRLEPTDIRPLGRPGRSEPDFVFFGREATPIPSYGVIELKKPSSEIISVTRSNIAILSRDAQTAVAQAAVYASTKSHFVIPDSEQAPLFIGSPANLFVIMGMSAEIASKLGVQIYREIIEKQLPPNLKLIPFDTLLRSFESALPRRIHLLVPAMPFDSTPADMSLDAPPVRGHRIIRSRLREYLSRDELMHLRRTAASIGIAENTLRALLRDDWSALSRGVIERVCDRFRLQITDLFEFVGSTFFESFGRTQRCVLLRSGGPSHAHYDAQARSILTAFISASVDPGIDFFIKDSTDESEILRMVRSENCIIAGSPRTNAATEIVLAGLFGAVPFTPTASERAKIPFKFVLPQNNDVRSTLVEPWRANRGTTSGVGLCEKSCDRMFIEVDWLPVNEFMTRTIQKARDVAIVAVIDRPFGATNNVKTVVLAGLTGIGTEAAAQAICRDFKDLEPAAGGFSIGVVEAIYNKPIPNSSQRNLVSYGWKYLRGGRRDIS